MKSAKKRRRSISAKADTTETEQLDPRPSSTFQDSRNYRATAHAGNDKQRRRRRRSDSRAVTENIRARTRTPSAADVDEQSDSGEEAPAERDELACSQEEDEARTDELDERDGGESGNEENVDRDGDCNDADSDSDARDARVGERDSHDDRDDNDNDSKTQQHGDEGEKKDVISNGGSDETEAQQASTAEAEQNHPKALKLALAEPAKQKTGVVYISRLPPGMDTTCVRALLSKVGPLNRMWLRPRDNHGGQKGSSAATGGDDRAAAALAAAAGRHRTSTSSSPRFRASFRDGWVEFVARRDAKRAVALLNGRPMAVRGRWADDLWTLRLLRGFGWDDLATEVFGAARERVRRAVAEVADARRERAWVESRAALGRRIEKRAERPTVRHFRQRRVLESAAEEDERKAAEAAVRVDRELDSGKSASRAKTLDNELVGMLFKRQRLK